MKRYRIVVISLVVGGLALAGFSGAALAQAPLEPVQHVYPDSPYGEIQQAIDNGGTVYFERLTDKTRQPADYNQVASSTPDLPPKTSLDAKEMGFFIGRNGKDVDIIGVLGPNGERPKINGGTLVFRVGTMAGMGVFGLPVNFKIENLELFNPDLSAAGGLYSRVGLELINVIGTRTTINNCKITVTGKENDAGHLDSHSGGIFILLFDASPESLVPTSRAPTNGARIDITNNTIIGTKIHNAIGVANFWPETPTFTPPRVFISNNSVSATNLISHGDDTGAAISLSGDFSNSTVTSNIIRGDGRYPGAASRQQSAAIRLARPRPGDMYSTNLTFVGNDSSSFAGDFQLWMDDLVSWSTMARNAFGPASTSGVMCHGHDNWFDRDHFYGDYPGWDSSGTGPGLVCFTKTSAGNRLTQTRLNRTLDICGQVDDQTAGANMIPGYDNCLTK